MSALVGSHRASRGGPSTAVTDTNHVTIKSRSYTTPRDSAAGRCLMRYIACEIYNSLPKSVLA